MFTELRFILQKLFDNGIIYLAHFNCDNSYHLMDSDYNLDVKITKEERDILMIYIFYIKEIEL